MPPHLQKRVTAITERTHSFRQEYGLALGLTAGLLALSACLQIWWQSSPITLSEEIWQKKLDTHLSYYPFAIRPFQSQATLYMHKLLGLPIRESFFAIQFTLALILGGVFYRFLRLLEFSRKWSLTGLAALMLSYPILGAHFAPTHTWDDIWCYLFIVLTFTALVRNRPVTSGLYLTLGCFAREQALVFYPLLLLWAWWSRKEINRVRALIMLTLPIVVYGAYRWIVFEDFEFRRFFHLKFNFETALRVNDTIVSAWIAFGLLWVLTVIGLVKRNLHRRDRLFRLIFWGVLITLPITVILTLTSGMARETRIFFPPFLFLIPISLYALKDLFDRLHPFRTWPGRISWAAAIVITIALGYQLALVLFPHFDYGTNAVFRRQLAGIHIGLTLSLLMGYVVVWVRERRRSRISARP